ncbi:MAG: AAA family ATPase [Bacilli bacterium]
MYLKQIKAVGFKSFAEKTMIDFDQDLTAIVGPNGSGKSNVVDAVRWVLGEQSVKTLRGEGNMTDVIFSGSKSRMPSNSATVTLLFDNSDSYFPLEFSEISIKRKVYKTGENEYYLNNEKCRLKDIINLILDTGMGKDAFNVISQGDIQEILSNKPEERRIIFEEAAGVLKYKKRKEEALRKLDKTHFNIQRINDILNEIESQLEPLKEQSEKAKIYVNAKKELESVEISLIVHDIEKFNNEYQIAKDQIDSLNDELSEMSETSSSVDAEVESQKLELMKLNDKFRKSQEKYLEISKEVERLNGQKILLTEQGRYQSEDTKLHDQLIFVQEKKLSLINQIKSLESELNSNQIKKADYFKQIEKLSELKNESNLKSQKYQENLENFNKEKMMLIHKNNIIESALENNSFLPRGISSVLNNPKLRGIHNTIGNLLKVDESHSLAIDVALGGSSNFIVVDDEKKASEAISYLKENSLGRATFFPLNIIKRKFVDKEVLNQLHKENNFIDLASNLVSFDSQYEEIILNQLGNVLVAKDITSANEISKKINHRYKIVTLDGEVIHVGGSLTGGTLNSKNSLLSQKQELKQNEIQIKVLETKIENLMKTKSKTNQEANQINQEFNNVKTLQAVTEELINKQSEEVIELKNQEQEQEMLLANLNSIVGNNWDDREEKILNDYYEQLNQKQILEKEINDYRQKIETISEKISDSEKDAKKQNSLSFSKQNILKEQEIKVNRLDVKLDNLLNTLNEDYSLTYEKAKEDFILMIPENDARKIVNQNKKIMKDLGIVNIAAIEEFERINERYIFLNDQKNDLFKAENTLLEIIKEMDNVMKDSFINTFDKIAHEFKITFKELFGGGEACLKLTDPQNILETGIDIVALPPGKKLQHLSLLSGGEKSLTAIAILFAILKVRPVPFCILDEVEAALDDSNVVGFGKFLLKLKSKTQFILITHKKKTMEYVDKLYGITMQESGVSKLVSVKLAENKNEN